MTQGAEAFQPKFDHDEEHDEEIKPREAVILPFKQREDKKGPSINPEWLRRAKFMADTAGITLSDTTIDHYVSLCREEPNPAKEYQESDQKLLAEALRRSGDEASLAKFLDVKNYPHIVKPKP